VSSLRRATLPQVLAESQARKSTAMKLAGQVQANSPGWITKDRAITALATLAVIVIVWMVKTFLIR
jgi:hypothetical protein